MQNLFLQKYNMKIKNSLDEPLTRPFRPLSVRGPHFENRRIIITIIIIIIVVIIIIIIISC
jgi:hypothetical protein